MNLVVDAGIAMKWFLDEPDSDQAHDLIAADHVLNGPDSLILEVGNVLGKAHRIRVVDSRFFLDAVHVKTPALVRILPVANFTSDACQIVSAYGGSFYDALYVACARSLNLPLMTADREMARVARKAGAAVLRLGEI